MRTGLHFRFHVDCHNVQMGQGGQQCPLHAGMDNFGENRAAHMARWTRYSTTRRSGSVSWSTSRWGLAICWGRHVHTTVAGLSYAGCWAETSTLLSPQSNPEGKGFRRESHPPGKPAPLTSPSFEGCPPGVPPVILGRPQLPSFCPLCSSGQWPSWQGATAPASSSAGRAAMPAHANGDEAAPLLPDSRLSLECSPRAAQDCRADTGAHLPVPTAALPLTCHAILFPSPHGVL